MDAAKSLLKRPFSLQNRSILVVMYFKIEHYIYSFWRLVGSGMSCEALFPFESLIAMVELEGFLQSMLLHVLLQITRSSANMVALVTREWFFTRVLSHYVLFQFTSCNTHTLCICLAFHQSVSSCEWSGGLIQLLSPLHSVSLRWLTEIMLRCNTPADHFPFHKFHNFWHIGVQKIVSREFAC